MIYSNIKEALFLERPNRFIAYAQLNNEIVTCHVKNTGRCRELLIPGKTTVYLEDHGENTSRKTRYSLVKARKGSRLVNLDSQAPNQIVFDWMQAGGLFSDLTYLKREHKFGNSRFDIYYERENGVKGFVEVKGVTQEINDVATFPDAPTERGVKHVYELIEAKHAGLEANIVFVIQMSPINNFTPNDHIHPEFGIALREANKQGVHIYAIDCHVTEDEIWAKNFVDVKF